MNIPFEIRFILFTAVILFIALYRLLWILRSIRKQKPEEPVDKKGFSMPVGVATGLLEFTAVALCVWGVRTMLSGHPAIVASSPGYGQAMATAADTLVFEFDMPINAETVKFYTNPPVDGLFAVERYLPFLPIGRRATFRPHLSLEPGIQMMAYFSSVQRPLSNEYGAEYLFEFSVPPLPDVSSATPGDGTMEIPTDATITYQLDKDYGPETVWSALVTPQHPFTLKRDSHVVALSFNTPLEQSATYSVTLLQAPAIFDPETLVPVETGTLNPIHAMTFSTVKAPLVREYLPQGEKIDPETDIRILFDHPMDTASVVLSMTPETQGTIKWNGTKDELVFSPVVLAKDTRYTVTIGKDAKSTQGGVMASPFLFSFRTLGNISVLATDPKDGSSSHQADGMIGITFDQEVERTSAEDSFSINPKVRGSFSWSGATMTFKPDAPLPYSTAYTVSLDPGIRSIRGLDLMEPFVFRFTTAGQEYSLPIPYFRQQESFTCNIAAARMLLAYRNISVTESAIKTLTGESGSRGNGNPHTGYTREYGTYWEPIHRAISLYTPAMIHTDWSLTGVIEKLLEGKPVMVWSQNGWSDPHELSWTMSDGTHIFAINGMHSYVVRGFRGPSSDPTHILVNDPWRGQYAMPTERFEHLWSYFRVGLSLE